MIKFIEKEPYYDNSPFTGQCLMYPTYMIKDGNELFMFNRREPDDHWRTMQNYMPKKQLVENKGSYITFSGMYRNPFEMLEEMAKRKHHFFDTQHLFTNLIREDGFVDFQGNRKEVSAAFFYRIYDKKIAWNISYLVKLLKQERFSEVTELLKKGE